MRDVNSMHRVAQRQANTKSTQIGPFVGSFPLSQNITEPIATAILATINFPFNGKGLLLTVCLVFLLAIRVAKVQKKPFTKP
jgi:hypothetical protein